MAKKENCQNCSNRVGEDYCTMQKDMEKAKYSKCDGFTIAKINPPREPVRTRKHDGIAVMKDDYFESDFIKFLRKGGHYSFRTGKHTPE